MLKISTFFEILSSKEDDSNVDEYEEVYIIRRDTKTLLFAITEESDPADDEQIWTFIHEGGLAKHVLPEDFSFLQFTSLEGAILYAQNHLLAFLEGFAHCKFKAWPAKNDTDEDFLKNALSE